MIGGLVLLAAGAAAVVTLVDMRGGGGGGGDTELIRDGAGVTYRVPTSWVGDDDNPPLVRWSEGDIVVAEITHASSDQVDAVAALQDAEPARCADLATRIDVVGADDAARCDNPDDTEAPAPATAVGVLADGELWLISLDRSLSSEVRDDFVDSLDFG